MTLLKSKSKIYLMFVLLLIVVFIIPTLAAEDKNKNFKIDYDRLKNNPEIESNLLEKSGAFAAEIQNQNTIKVVFELKDSDESYIKSLKDNGAVIEAVHKNLVQASIPSSQLQAMSGLPFVNHVRTPLRPYKDAVVSEGAGVINASLLHGIGLTGQNVKIAILDGGFEGYQSKLGTELPGSVTARSFRADGDITGGGEVHGTAVAEIVYDVAPDASLYLINFDTDVEFANAVDYAIGQNVDIISMSVNWLVGPFDGTGYIDEIVDNATSSGIIWVNSAGNFARKHWEGKFSGNGDNWHDFIPGDELMNLGYFGAETPIAVYLSWDDWPVSYQDYDLFLVNTSGYIVGGSTNNQIAGFPPYEALEGTVLEPGNYYLAIHKYQATREVNFELYSYYQELEHQVASSSLGIPADARGVIAVGVTHWSNDGLEPFSSQGPTNDGRTKPDVVAPDGVSTFTYGTGNFYGTSASAPHVAGAAALLMSANQSLTFTQVQEVLEAGALDLGEVGKDNKSGAGRINVWSAYQLIKPKTIIWDEESGSPLPFTWDISNFEGFNVSGTGTETLRIAQTNLGAAAGKTRTIRSWDDPSGAGLIYTTTRQLIGYEVSRNKGLPVEMALSSAGYKGTFGNYYAKVNFLSEPYVALNGQARKLVKLILEQKNNEQKILAVGETWDLGNGYSLKLNSADSKASPIQIELQLFKNGSILDYKIAIEGQVYTYVNQTPAGESNVPVFVTYLDNISTSVDPITGKVSVNSIRLKYTWLISQNADIIHAGDNIGVFTVTSAATDGLMLENKESITLAPNTTINLGGDLKFKVIDNITYLKFYPLIVTLVNISVSPSSWSMNITEEKQFTATRTYSDTSTADITATAAWSSSNTTVGTVTQAGVFTALANGTATVNASVGSIVGSAAVGVGVSLDTADDDGDRVISMPELISMIGAWKLGNYTMSELMTTIGRWKAGSY
jgi:S-layer protein (TIGR01567 family)